MSHFSVLVSIAPRRLNPNMRLDSEVAAGKARVGNIAALWEIDQKRVEATGVERRDTFLREYQALLGGKRFDAFEGPRAKAMRMGLLRVEQGPATAKDGEVIMPWADLVKDERRTWNDVATAVTAETLETKYGRCFHPLVTYAAVDNDGWHAPRFLRGGWPCSGGKMGWFVCSDDKPEQYLEWCDQFAPRFLSGDPMTTLVLVDCHV